MAHLFFKDEIGNEIMSRIKRSPAALSTVSKTANHGRDIEFAKPVKLRLQAGSCSEQNIAESDAASS